MFKVECQNCKEIGYTAAPNYLICKCGGRFSIIPENAQAQRTSDTQEILVKRGRPEGTVATVT